MIPAERQKMILNLLTLQDVISISQLVEELGVSHMTIRRDIVKLEQNGKVMSVSGGVQLTSVIQHEPPHETKATQYATEKKSIGQLASSFITRKCTVYLDAGTTSLEIARHLAKHDDLLIVTNDFVIANYLICNSNSEIYHTGGHIDRDNQSCVGSKVADFLFKMNIDIAFVSTSSWNLKGISTPNESKVIVKQAIASASQEVILVSDSSKYGKIGTFIALNIEQFSTIITDSNFSETIAAQLQDKGVNVLTCDLD
ncbi:DeoR family transcriptional regulator [Vibrio breoganii]